MCIFLSIHELDMCLIYSDFNQYDKAAVERIKLWYIFMLDFLLRDAVSSHNMYFPQLVSNQTCHSGHTRNTWKSFDSARRRCAFQYPKESNELDPFGADSHITSV